MLFTEMREKFDKVGAFNDYTSVSRVKAVGRIPTAFINYFPDYCECGSERIISYNLRTMQCTDPRCPIKQALALSNLFNNFGCKGVGEAICKQAYNEIMRVNQRRIANGEEPLLQSNSYLEILMLNRDHYSVDFIASAAGDSFIRYAEWIRNKVLTFPEMISKLGLPELETTALKLFRGINSFEELKQIVASEGGISNFCDIRGFHDPMKKYWLYVSLEDIYVASCIFAGSIRQTGLQEETICITGSIYPNGSRMTKNDFINYCNMRAYTKNIADILKDVITENEISVINAAGVRNLLNEFQLDSSFVEDNMLSQDFLNKVEELALLNFPIQILEISMSSAKMSARHIIADRESTSDKYKTGLLRGIEYTSDGTPLKVLISSDEYLAEIERRKESWTEQYKMKLLEALIISNSQLSTHLQKMSL